MEIQLGLAFLRALAGLVLAAHGAQKVFGWFGGPGIDGWRGAMQSMRMRPPGLWAWVSALTELLGGLLLALGILLPFVAAALVVDLFMAIILVHWQNGFFNANGGLEFPLTLASVILIAGLTPPGGYSLGPQGFAGLDSLPAFAGTLLVGALLSAVALAARGAGAAQEPRSGS